MDDGGDPVQAVLSSSVRADVLLAVAEGTRTTNDLLAALSASSSAVYNAIGRLEELALLDAGQDGWRVTGTGRLVADHVGQKQRLSSLLAESGDYFAAHDASVLPVEHRLRMSDLAGGWVLEATDTEPQLVVREISERLEEASRAWSVTPIYVESYVETTPVEAESRLILAPDVLETILETSEDAEDDDGRDGPAVRLADTDFAMTVTEETLLLSLPTLDGQYDAQTEFVADHPRALRWGERLFETVWASAEPVVEGGDPTADDG